MIPAQIIAAKRDHETLSNDQIGAFVRGFAEGDIPDYQMAALAMAIYLNGMSDAETAALTHHMLESGVRLQWPDDGIVRADKHSTGGVGDKISIPLAPILACCGLQIPMLSGRGLGATGGTLDKLESIPGFRTDLSLPEIQDVTQRVGCVITGASTELAPADRRLYALRDVTGTVPSIPLITASIMSKKLAESPDALVLDVKFGSGAFMKTRESAEELAMSLVRTGERIGVRTTALLTDMNQPLGRMCGNALEIEESIAILKSGEPKDVTSLTLELAAELLVSAGLFDSHAAAREAAAGHIRSGRALEKLDQMIDAQGGTRQSLSIAPADDICADRSGVITNVETEKLGLAVIAMGGGRKKMSDHIDHSVGLEYLVKVGQQVTQGQPLVRVYSKHPESVTDDIRRAIVIGESAEPLPLIVARLTADGVQSF